MFGLFQKKEHELVINDQPAMVLQPKETILNGALRNDVAFPYSCKVGGCGSCKCQLVEGKVRELTDKSYLLSKEEIEQNYILGCQSIPKTNVVIKLPTNALANQKINGTITEQKELTHDISEIVIHLESPMQFKPGQYANVKAAGTEIPARSYSFAHCYETQFDSELNTSTTQSQIISFFVRSVPDGRMSNWLLDSANLNSPVEIDGSYGEFFRRDSESRFLCVAGGSGLAPIVSVLEGAIRDAQPITRRPVELLMGARTQADLYYLEEIQFLQAQWQADFIFKPVLSEEPSDSGWDGLIGFVTDHLDQGNCQGSEGYLCGPPGMIDAAITKMNQFGIKSEHIFFDKFLDQSTS